LKRPTGFYLSLTGLALAIIAVLLAALSGFGHRWQWWPFSAGFAMLRWGGYAAAAAAEISLVSCFLTRPGGGRRGFIRSLLGLLIALLVCGPLFYWWRAAERAPVIHDITTDTANPPRFVSILPLRKEAQNTPLYEGTEVAEKQRAAYPDLIPATLPVPPSQAFDRALQTARAMGWTLVDANAAEGRLEAIDTTFWFGFKDDVIIRVASEGRGSRVDVRSVSRVGRSDLGTNARRIRRYLKKLTHED
jgi:uncharacterized protein (DUF1499 family)